MAEAVAGLLASGFVGIAKDKLGSAIAEQASLLWNFGDDLEEMKNVLEIISAALEDAERRSTKEKLVQLWLKRLEDVALDIYDMLEDYQDSSDQITAKNPGALSCIPTTYKKIAIANSMKSLRKELRKIHMEFGNFKFINTQGTSTTNVQHYNKFETTSHFLPQVEGREGEKQEIINLLHASSNQHDEGETVILSIYALGGMGKTTLAQLVYNDDQLKKQYDCHIWVYVSQDFNLLKIGNSIISQLQGEGAHRNRDLQNTDLQVIMQCLDNLLCTKKVMIVLDDLWEEDDTELSKLKSMLHVGKKGSKIDVIVTTREEGIARKVSTSKLYKLQPLMDDECWEIIKRSSECNQQEFEQIGLDIAKKCGGVPLAAQALGYMLQSKDLSEWKKINDSDIWNETSDDKVLPSLRLSYHRMSRQLRMCFSYCAIFSKGHNIVEDDLIQQWTVLGFIETSKGKEYIKHLLGMSFLQVSKMPSTSQKHVVRYTMHDLVHDLARLTMSDQLKIYDVAPPRKTSAHKYFRYSLLKKYDSTTKLENMPSKMRALHFSDSVQLNIGSGAFSFAICLRILDFSECSGVLLPASIGKLKQLRCLIAPRMQNESLPECITELSKLQYLNLNESPQISALPDSVGNLGYLKYLCLSGCSGISELPESFGNLKSMAHLDMSGCSGIRAVPECICELPKLQYLNINGCSRICALPESIGKLGCLQYICLSGCSGISKLPESFGDLKFMARLDMSGCSGITNLPDSLGSLKNLQHLELSGCSSLHALPESLCGLTQLKYLNMSSCGQIRELPESLVTLRNLQHLDLSDCRSMQHLGCVRGLTALQHLDMSYCRSIDFQDLSDILSNLTNNLRHLSLINLIITGAEGTDSYVPYWIGGLTNLEHLNLSLNNGLACLPGSIGNLKRLHTLDLTYCGDLKSLPESIGTLGLKSLLLDGCLVELLDHASSLVHYSKILPFFRVRADDVNGGRCSNLHLLEDKNVGELRIHFLENVRSLEEANKVKLSDKHNLSELTLAWSIKHEVQFLDDKDLLGQLVPPRGLKHMRLEGYSSSSFPDWFMGISHHLTNLVSITLQNLSTCSSLPPLGQLPHLEALCLFSLNRVTKIDSTFCGGKGAFRRLARFSIIFMKGLEEWNTTYSVENDEAEFMFPVLDSLTIDWCPKLRLKPCPPTFRECEIRNSDHVISSLDKVDKIGDHFAPSRPVKLGFSMGNDYGQCQGSMRLLHHFPGLQELSIFGCNLTSFPESIRHLTTLQVLSFAYCDLPTLLPESIRHLTSIHSLELRSSRGISELPEWLGDLSSLKSLDISSCKSIKSLPSCIQQLTNLQTLEITADCPELKEWCESEENKTKLAHISNVRIHEE